MEVVLSIEAVPLTDAMLAHATMADAAAAGVASLLTCVHVGDWPSAEKVRTALASCLASELAMLVERGS